MPPPRILLVEDDPDLAASMAAILEDGGYQVEIAHDGPTSLAAAHAELALLLVDYHLPGEPTGKALVGALRDCCGPRTRVLIISAEREVEERAREAGADGYLEKPFNIEALLETVRRHVSSSNDTLDHTTA
jgi:two-component system, OmpR family, response regulator